MTSNIAKSERVAPKQVIKLRKCRFAVFLISCKKTCIDCGYQTEEEMEQNEITEQAEIAEEETEQAETAEEETEQAETAEEETKQPEVTEPETIEQDGSESGEPQTPETDESPVLSVSGNDCAGKEGQEKMEGQDETEDKTEELEDGEGEKE